MGITLSEDVVELEQLESSKVLIYSVIYDDYDEGYYNYYSNCDWEIFTGSGDKKANRELKCLPPYFEEYDYSIYIDGNLELLFHPHRLILDYLKFNDIATFKHPKRCCIYQEAVVIKRNNLDSAEVVQKQIERYKKEQYPPANGLGECAMLIRRHTQKVWDFGQSWWKEIQEGSCRDQLSFDYVAWKKGVSVFKIQGGKDGSNLVKVHPHLKPRIDFIYS